MGIPVLKGPDKGVTPHPSLLVGPTPEAESVSSGMLELKLAPGQDPIERRRKIRLMDIKVKGPLIQLVQKDEVTGKRFSTLISRRDALKRAEAISGLNESSVMFQRALIRACREAYENETGHDYESPALKLIDAEEKSGHESGKVSW